MDETLRWIRDTPLGYMVRDVPDFFPVCESLHFVGLSLLMGAMLVVDLRILGMFRQMPYAAALKLIPLAILGFMINLATGICFLAANPFLYFTNPAFYVKLALIALGGLNAVWFTFAEHRQIAGLSNDAEAPTLAKIMAVASLLMWTVVLLAGRLLPTFAPVAGG